MSSSDLLVVIHHHSPSVSTSAISISSSAAASAMAAARKMSIELSDELEICFEDGSTTKECKFGSYGEDYSDDEDYEVESDYDEDDDDDDSCDEDDNGEDESVDYQDQDDDDYVTFGGSISPSESILLVKSATMATSVQFTIFDILNTKEDEIGEEEDAEASGQYDDGSKMEAFGSSRDEDSGIEIATDVICCSDELDLFSSGLFIDKLFRRSPQKETTESTPPKVAHDKAAAAQDDNAVADNSWPSLAAATTTPSNLDLEMPASPQIVQPFTAAEDAYNLAQKRMAMDEERKMRAAVVEANRKWNAAMAEPEEAIEAVDAQLNRRRVNFSTAGPQIFLVERLDISEIVGPPPTRPPRFALSPQAEDEDDDDYEPEELLFQLEF